MRFVSSVLAAALSVAAAAQPVVPSSSVSEGLQAQMGRWAEDAGRQAHVLEEKARAAQTADKGSVPADGMDAAVTAALEAVRSVQRQKVSPEQATTADEMARFLSIPRERERFYRWIEEALAAHPEVRNFVPDIDTRLLPAAPGTKPPQVTFVFISRSLGEAALKEIFERASGHADVTLVVPGVPKGTDVAKGIQALQALAREVNPTPNVVLDPTLFTAYGVTAVPTVVRAQPEELLSGALGQQVPLPKPKLVAVVRGLGNDTWLKRQIEAGKSGDLGQQGEVYPVSEPDLIEEMKTRFLAIDWDKKKQEALDRFWKLREFVYLPTVGNDAVREVDPSFVLANDLKDAADRVLVAAGTHVNPLERRLFTMAVVVFNPTRKNELAAVDAQLPELKKSYGRIVLLATEIDRDKGWDGFARLEDHFTAPIFLLTPDLRDLWRLTATPSFVTADNDRHVFVVREVKPHFADAGEAVKTAAETKEPQP